MKVDRRLVTLWKIDRGYGKDCKPMGLLSRLKMEQAYDPH